MMDASVRNTPSRKVPSRTGWLKNPKIARPGEAIGGGYFVFRRGDDTGRIRPANWPFEYATQEAAQAQANILASRNPGYRFDIVHVVASVTAEDAQTSEVA